MITDYFKIEKAPKKGLLPLEWAMLAYMGLTIVVMLFTYTKLVNPDSMIWGRIRVLVMTGALWTVYRMVPCRATRLARVVAQMSLLAWWYPDIYELNRIFPNLDHVFAGWEQQIFGCQPALYWAKAMPWMVVSELLDMGYFMYYPMIGIIVLYYFFRRYQEFERVSFILLAGFFLYYVMFIFIPVVGPTFYYNAVGVSEISKGIFPAMGDYFNTHTDCLTTPGYADGIFYQLVEDAKATGERPVAAFPSSHVSMSTICLLLAWHSKNRKLTYLLLPFYILLCIATVYIQAHYLIDALAGFVTAIIIYFILMYCTRNMKESLPGSAKG